jgi:para-nitrobenzyl esterase
MARTDRDSQADASDAPRRFVEVTTRHGRLRGVDRDGIQIFKGIPYGGSTAGKNRFMPPTPAPSWSGVRDALEFGPVSPQPEGNGGAYAEVIGWGKHPSGMSEDCLCLNVWTPGVADGARRPVLFSIHGGGFVTGAGSIAGYNGYPLAVSGDVVVVTVNHRLGVLGCLHLGDLGGPAEYESSSLAGMLDLVAALQWVRDNIEHFGGDPGNVTIFGQSGGGAKTTALLAMPDANGLFHRAGVQSGSALRMSERSTATASAERLLAELGLRRDQLQQLQELPFAALIEAQTKLAASDPSVAFWPVVDGRTLPQHPFDPTAPQVSAQIPMIIGTTLDDAGMRGRTDLDEAGLRSWTERRFGERADAILRAYRGAYPDVRPNLVQARILTDRRGRRSASLMAERKAALGAAAAYLYLFSWPSPAMGGRFGAVHGVDVGLTFNNTRGMLAGDTPEAHELARQFSAAWVAFARTGDPNHPGIPHWESYDPSTRPTMIFDTEIRATHDPLHDLRLLWEQAA